MKGFATLTRVIREHFRELGGASVLEKQEWLPESAYDEPVGRAITRALRAERHVEHAMQLVGKKYQLFLELPEAQREILVENSTPTFLTVLARKLMEQSFEQRLGDTSRGLALAELALRVAHSAVAGGGFAHETGEDLLAEAYGKLANARRVRSDLTGARLALVRAEAHAAAGTLDRMIRADLLSFRGYLACDVGDAREAITLADREIKLRRLVHDPDELGRALIHRGWLACWVEPLDVACRFHREGVLLASDPRHITVGLCSLALRLVRDGDGASAWRTLTTAQLTLELAGDSRLRTEHRWVSGLALHAIGDDVAAFRELRAVRRELRADGSRLGEGFCCLDLACLEIANGEPEAAMRHAKTATEVFEDLAVDKPMLAALILLAEAIRARTVTEAFAASVAHFVRRYQIDRTLRFDSEGS